MKRTLIILLCSLLSIGSLYAETKARYKPQDTLYVHALSGLNLRDKAGMKSKILSPVPFGEKVEVLEKPSVAFDLEKIRGHWVKVKYKGKTGYLFDGFLSRLTAPDLDVVPMSEVIPKYIQKIKCGGDVKDLKVSEDGPDSEHTIQDCGNGIQYEKLFSRGETTGGWDKLKISGISDDEGINFIKALYNYDLKQVKSLKEKTEIKLREENNERIKVNDGEIYIGGDVGAGVSILYGRDTREPEFFYIMFNYGGD